MSVLSTFVLHLYCPLTSLQVNCIRIRVDRNHFMQTGVLSWLGRERHKCGALKCSWLWNFFFFSYNFLFLSDSEPEKENTKTTTVCPVLHSGWQWALSVLGGLGWGLGGVTAAEPVLSFFSLSLKDVLWHQCLRTNWLDDRADKVGGAPGVSSKSMWWRTCSRCSSTTCVQIWWFFFTWLTFINKDF